MIDTLSRLTLIAAISVPSFSQAAEPRYRFVELPELPGGGPTVALALNNSGEIVGSSNYHACLWGTDGNIVDLHPAAAHTSSAADINEAGVVVGTSWDQVTIEAFRFQDTNANGSPDLGEWRVLVPLAGSEGASAVAVNDAGQVVGASHSPSAQVSRATLWGPDGEPRYIGELLGSSFATAINNDGVILGGTYDLDSGYAWIRDGGGLVPMTGVRGRRSVAAALNDQLQVAGHRNDTAFLWQDNDLRDLHEILPLGTRGDEATSTAINEDGIIVGEINYESEPGGRESAGFLWDKNGGLVLLDSLVAPFGGTTTLAADINDRSEIVGGFRRRSDRGAFLLVPFGEGSQLFVRGDANVDGAVDVSDGIATLDGLFQSGDELPCGDAADANDSGAGGHFRRGERLQLLVSRWRVAAAAGPVLLRYRCDRGRAGLRGVRLPVRTKPRWKMAERRGFEPREPVRAHWFSKPARSAAPAPLRALRHKNLRHPGSAVKGQVCAKCAQALRRRLPAFALGGLVGLLLVVLGKGIHGVYEILRRRDVVAREDAGGPVLCDSHRDALRDAGTNQIPAGSATAVVQEFTGQVRGLRCLAPGAVEVLDGLSISVKNVVGE